MPTKKWILPEGIEDILPEQAYWLELKRREVANNFVKTPQVEEDDEEV